DMALTAGLHYFDTPGTVGNPWFGKIDEPAYWNRALTAGEVAADYAAHTSQATACSNPAARTFTVDANPPTAALASGPANGLFADSANVVCTWTGSDGSGTGVAGYSYRLDGAPYNAYSLSTVASFSGLAEGPHQFDLRAKDLAGNETVQSCTINTLGLVSWWS